MSTTRRGFLGALLATPLLARLSWAKDTATVPSAPELPEVETFKGARGVQIWGYSESAVMAVPEPGRDGCAYLARGKRLSMVLPCPSKANDGDCLTIIGSNADISVGNDLFAFGNDQRAVKLIAMNRAWVVLV